MARTSYTYPGLIGILEKGSRRISEFDNVPDDLFVLKPDSATWSADEICQHLVRFNTLYIQQVDNAVKTISHPPTAEGPFTPTLIPYMFMKFLEPPYKMKMKTLAPMYPYDSENTNPAGVRTELLDIISGIENRIRSFQEQQLHIGKIKGRNPVAKFLPMAVIDFILVLDAHQRRHFWQIEQTLFKLSGQKY